MKAFAVVSLVVYACLAAGAAAASDAEIARGKYLANLAGCHDCHTPGFFLGKPDFSRALSGSDVAFGVSGLGAFVGRNLTPDKETGLGNWSAAEIATAITTGVRPDGRKLAPIMPYAEFSYLEPADAKAIVAYLKSLPAIRNAVPGPFGPKETPSTLVFAILPGEIYAETVHSK